MAHPVFIASDLYELLGAVVVKESALILMQTVPTHIQVAELKKKLIKNVRCLVIVIP